MNIIAEFDRLLSFREGEHSAEYAEGRDQGLATGRKLALAYVKQCQAMDIECSKLIHQLLEENAALLKQQDEARHDLARAVGLIVPGHHTSRSCWPSSASSGTRLAVSWSSTSARTAAGATSTTTAASATTRRPR